MILGLFVRHYKIYKNINFIPISNGVHFSAFIGPNGAGKSSVLDALDKFFNGGDWSINLQAKAEGGLNSDDKLPYIVPLFALPKDELRGEDAVVAEVISEYLWSTNLKTADALTGFYKLRDSLRKNGLSKETHYLLAIGRQHGRQNAYLASFDSDTDLTDAISTVSKTKNNLNNLLERVVEKYAYFYIPVEADAVQFSKLESSHVQKLLDEDIKAKIQEAIGTTTISTINTSLQGFVNEVSDSLKSYKYKGTFKDRLTMNDLIEKVFEAYFSIKILHKQNPSSAIPIRDLSAGEKRAALIDLAYSLLARSQKRSHRVILAIDEPDASLHASACHDHFARLADIPELTNPKTQVLITTHWYGFLPIVQHGIVHSISEASTKQESSKKPDFFSFDLYNYREQIKQAIRETSGEYPRDIELKSYNDMLQAIVSSLVRTQPYNWILCEGLSDKIYLDFYLKDLIRDKNLRIVPLGGFKEVRRAFQYLRNPLEDPEYKISGKVLCLVDTDAQLERIDSKPECKSIDFRRIIFKIEENDVALVKIDDQLVSPATEIEHALEGKRFSDVANSLPDTPSNNDLKKIIAEAKTVTSAKTSYAYLNLTPSENRAMMEKYFDLKDNKTKFANAYVSISDSIESTPRWIQEVRDYFLPTKKSSPKKN